MSIKNLTINSADFYSEGTIKGYIDSFIASAEDDTGLITLRIHPIRNLVSMIFSAEDIYVQGKIVKLPTKIISKLLRLTKEYDKLGKKSIDL